ncbi:MAG: phosphotransferase [Eubacterium sp.]|nr:phosphotransferase [Eubacterium sp.]
MYLLTKENLTEYLQLHMPYLDYSKPLTISAIGEGTMEEDGDGYINFVFRVSDGNYKLIIKQAREKGRVVDIETLPLNRVELEYESMKFRSVIVPEYIPKVYFFDKENYVLVTEDVSHLSIMRFALNRGKIFPRFARQAAEYLAKTHFYTSEYYLDSETFRNMTIHFMNHGMRDIFDSHGFMFKEFPEQSLGGDIDPRYMSFVEELVMDPRVIMERKKLRHVYMSSAEVFVHGDFHTSNTFIGPDELKIIDMEYTFAGPQSYDLGYMEAQLMSQYLTANFRKFSSDADRWAFRKYMMDTMRDFITCYMDVFSRCWEEDAKDFYRHDKLLLEDIKRKVLREMAAFCANQNLSRTAGYIGFPEYDIIQDMRDQSHAIGMSVMADIRMLQNYCYYRSVDDFLREITEVEDSYKIIMQRE